MSDGARSRCEVLFEDWPPGWVAATMADPSPDALRTGIDALADLLTSLVDRPDLVTLVLAADVGQAVVRRDPSGPYTMARGSGTVAGKTMRRDDGGVDIIVDCNPLVDADDSGVKVTAAGAPSVRPDGVEFRRRTIAHEAQHANMELSGSGFNNYGQRATWGRARRYQFAMARQMCDEHRAEWNAAQVGGAEPPTAGEVLDVLCHMGQVLTAAAARFQQSIKAPTNVEELREEVYRACAPFWTQVAYWAAEYREGDEISAVAKEITQLMVWQRYVGPTWASMARALSQLPVTVSTPPDVLHQAAREVAMTVDESLRHIGFRHLDGIQGESFFIDRNDFPSPRE